MELDREKTANALEDMETLFARSAKLSGIIRASLNNDQIVTVRWAACELIRTLDLLTVALDGISALQEADCPRTVLQ